MDAEDMSFFDEIEQTIFAEIDKAMNVSADKIAKRLSVEMGEEAAHELLEHSKDVIKHDVHDIREKGLQKIDKAFHSFERNKNRFLTQEELHHVKIDFQQVPSYVRAFQKKKGAFEKTLQETLEIPDFVLYCFYLVAQGLFKENNYEESSNIFLLLTTLSPFVKDYWMALGISEKSHSNFEEALAAFVMASIMDLQDPEPHFQIIECSLSNGEVKGAQVMLEEAKHIVERQGDPLRWRERLNQLEEQINQMKSSL